ncbi:MAG: hypothetical protein ACUVQ5_02975 [Candidatus Methanomethylicaceae archaeon]
MKREARVAFVEYIEDGDLTVAFIFRGGWIDGITMARGLKDFKGLEAWLKETGYLEELSGISLGEGMRLALGERLNGGVIGLPVLEVRSRNRREAEVIIKGIREWFKSGRR